MEPLRTRIIWARTVRGGTWIVAGQLTTIGVGLALTPFILHRLGTEAYGALNLTALVVNYFAFSDLGTNYASTKFGAEAHARGDETTSVEVIWTALTLAALSTLAVAALVAAVAPTLVSRFFNLPGDLRDATVLALRFGCIALVARSLAGVLNTPEVVQMRFGLYSAIQSGFTVLQTCITLLVLSWGGGLVAASAVLAGTAVIMMLAHGVAATRLQPGLIHPRFRAGLAGTLLRYGAPFVQTTLVGTALFHGERFLLVKLGSIKLLAYYSLIYTLAQFLELIPVALAQPLMPSFAHYHAVSNRESLRYLYGSIVSGLLLLLPAVALGIVATGGPFLATWAGPDFALAGTWALPVLVVGMVLNCLALVPRTLLAAIGRHGIVARIHSIEVAPYLLLAALLIRRYGLLGAAVAWTTRCFVECVLMFWLTSRVARLTPSFLSWEATWHEQFAILGSKLSGKHRPGGQARAPRDAACLGKLGEQE